MPDGLYVLAGLSVLVLVWAYKRGLPHIGKPSYQDLLDEKAKLNAATIHWKYADGSLVPQHKRMKMFKDLHRVSRKIRKHPDHPDNSQR